MSNETISVPRELLERACSARNSANGWMVSADAIRELRALLAQPAETVDTEQWWSDTPDGEPALVTRVGALTEWQKGRNTMRAERDAALKELAELKAKQHHGEPVALQHMAVAEGGRLRWMTGRKMQDCELYALPDGGSIREPLYTRPAEQPAPVLPEHKIINVLNYQASIGADGWNACLEEVVRLNPPQQ